MQFIKSDVNINFIGKRKIAFIVSVAMILVSIISLILHGGTRQGIDFAGGVMIQGSLQCPYYVAPAVAGVLWLFLFDPTLGILPELLSAIGIDWNHKLNGDQAMLLVVLAVVVGPMLLPWEADFTDWEHASTPPSLETGHWFGTDAVGRDILARTLEGGRISLLVGLVATLVSLVIGVSYGAIAGYYGGMTDRIMMRSVDIIYALPFMFFVILLVAYGAATFIHLMLVEIQLRTGQPLQVIELMRKLAKAFWHHTAEIACDGKAKRR